jgi:hypothetical protein
MGGGRARRPRRRDYAETVSATLLDGGLSRRSILNRRELQAILAEHESGGRNREALIWNLAMLNLWLDHFAPT